MLEGEDSVSGSFTRIASISGLRGIVGAGIDPVVAAEFAAAYASECDEGVIVLGHDGRVSAPMFVAAVEAGITATGHDVIMVGATATPTIGILVRDHQAAGGIQISASHNPPNYNGLKFFQRAGMVLSQRQGAQVLDRWQRRDFRWSSWDSLGNAQRLENPDRSHLEGVLSIVDSAAIKRKSFKVVLDACHGAGGRLGMAMLRALGCRSLTLGALPDGLYDHTPEPTESNLKEFAAMVPAIRADVGFAQDPDADRLAIVDEMGHYIGEELTLALAATRRLQQAKGAVVLNLSTSRVTEVLASRQGCPVLRTPVGEINVVERMLVEDALLGGEGNGGVIDPRVGYVRDSFAAMALVLDLMAATGESLSHLVAGLPRYAMIKDQYPIAKNAAGESSSRSDGTDVTALWDRIEAACADARADRRDGLRLDWDDRWVHVRASNTEPIVRVIAEAPDAGLARQLADKIGRWVRDTEGPP
jgi:phosphomannomutase